MENANILVYDKNGLYFESLEEMASDFHVKLNFFNLKKSNDFKMKSRKQHLFFIVYDPIDFYLLFENKIDSNNLIIATKNYEILNSLENTFHIKYVDLNLRYGIIRNISKLLKRGTVNRIIN